MGSTLEQKVILEFSKFFHGDYNAVIISDSKTNYIIIQLILKSKLPIQVLTKFSPFRPTIYYVMKLVKVDLEILKCYTLWKNII